MEMINKLYKILASLFIISLCGCHVPELTLKNHELELPNDFLSEEAVDSSIVQIKWSDYFQDENLVALIETALNNNQELNVVLQEIEISNNEVLERSGEYLPFVNVGVATELDKPGRYTRAGAVEHELEIEPGREFPEPLGNIFLGATASWEVDIWKKLRNAKSAAEMRALANSEGKNFLVTQLISEIADHYYELIALDNLLEIVSQNQKIQSVALNKVKQLKNNAQATQLAVNRFEAQLMNTTNLQFELRQKLITTENELNILLGRFPEEIDRSSEFLPIFDFDTTQVGLPAQLLENRPDIRKAKFELLATNLDVQVARAAFFPNLDLRAGLGFEAFNPVFLVNPQSVIFNLAGDLMTPVINRKAVEAQYNMASATQIQKVFQYQQTVLSAYADVLNELAKLNNYSKSVETKEYEVSILNKSVSVANNLFKFAKADYVEVLLTQEEALDAQMELVESKLYEAKAKVQLYRALGGGWK